MAQRTITADENTKEKRRTGTRGGSRGSRGKEGHAQMAAQALDDTGGSKKKPKARPTAKKKKSAWEGTAAQLEKGRRSNTRRKGSSGAARRNTGARVQKLEQRGETASYRRKTSGKKKTRARS